MLKILTLFYFCVQLNQVNSTDIHLAIARAAGDQVGVTIKYVSKYERLSYPNGDVPKEQGVCSDVIIRAFRKVAVDLQKEVHEDMVNHFSAYPNYWMLKVPDHNIDHRRVPNLMTYFKRKGKSVGFDSSYKAGDVVAWKLSYGFYHIGIVSEEVVPDAERNFMIHNIGSGAKKEDVLLQYEIIGHYRW
ncbi:MAG: DUF1287 domain-containing protein [Bacteroidota bacterium]|nr:DUF1287 domain-containing protein [Bacteroidota bacterium]